MLPIMGMDEPWRYRNKAQFPWGLDKDGKPVAGFYAGRTHAIIGCEDCLLGVEENREVLGRIKTHMERYHLAPYDESTHKGLIRHTLIRKGFQTGELMVCQVINGNQLPHSEELVKSLLEIPGMTSISLNVNKEQTNVILGNKVENLFGPGYITDYIGSVQYRISPLSFYQVNPVQTKKLYETALEYAGLTGGETVWDLYCGIGTISLFLAQKAKKVYGVEIVPQAIDDARENARLNGIENAEFFVGKAEEVLPEQFEKNQVYADVIVVDPPRKGCDEKCLETIVKMGPKRVVYVSCDSATLARDLKYLAERGYELDRVRGCDMFPWTTHVETVVGLRRKDL
jgi:23S rRNA (uracil1939-C5)-methyltransferase